MLTAERIQQLSTEEGVKRMAVENFLSTLHGMTQQEATSNLSRDALMYKWNPLTMAAIRQGIREYFKAS